MGVKKQVPRTDDAREAALTAGKNRKDAVDPADNAFSTVNSAALDVHQPLFILKLANVRSIEERIHDFVIILDLAVEKMKNRTSHGLQLVNFQIIDGKPGWVVSNRTFYKLPLDGRLPAMGTIREVIQMATNFINGETSRIAAGGIALQDITKAEVVGQLADVNAKLVLLQDAKNDLVEANKELATERLAVDTLTPLLWNDVEHKAQSLTTGARHEFGMLWGMSYKNTKGFGILNASVEDIDTHEKLAGIDLRLGSLNGKDGTKATTNLHGEAIIESHNLKDTFIVASNIVYDTLGRAIKLIESEELTIVLKLKKKNIES